MEVLFQLNVSLLTAVLLVFFVFSFSCFIKISVALSVIRIGFGFLSFPSAFIVFALSLGLSIFVMSPTIHNSLEAVKVAQNNKKSANIEYESLQQGFEEWKKFLIKHTKAEEVHKFSALLAVGEESKYEWRILIPAFLVSELKSAFMTAFSLFLPFLVVELIVSGLLVAVGLINVSSSLISFPFKLLLFVMVDGWSMITTNLVSSYLT